MSKNTNLSFLTDYITADITNTRIGIHNTSPSYSLDLIGNMRVSGSVYLATTAGSVGIGTTTPLATLAINAANQVTDSYGLVSINTTNSQAINLGGQLTLGGVVTGSSQTVFGAIAGRKESSTSGEYTGYLQFNTMSGSVQERARITSAGNVGIGVSSLVTPGGSRNLLQISNGTNGGQIALGSSTTESNNPRIFSGQYDLGFAAGITTGIMQFYTNDTERMRITSGGFTKMSNDGTYIGITSPYHEIRTSTTDNNIALFTNSSASPYGPNIWFPNASPNNGANYFLSCDDSTNQKAVILSNGNFGSRTNSYGGISDIKVKENINPATSKLDDLLKVNIVNYNFIDDESKQKQIGVISQELEKIFPNMVYESKDKNTGESFKNVKYSIFVPMLVKAIQELSAKVSLLENK